MKKSKKSWGKISLALGLSLFFLFLSFAPYLRSAPGGDICTQALEKCAVDAAIVGVFSGIVAGLGYLSFCIAGYDWCRRYIPN
ncbi:MAG: hypothetical protein WCC06_07555 [Candidatus Aminicenantales bacterium]